MKRLIPLFLCLILLLSGCSNQPTTESEISSMETSNTEISSVPQNEEVSSDSEVIDLTDTAAMQASIRQSAQDLVAPQLSWTEDEKVLAKDFPEGEIGEKQTLNDDILAHQAQETVIEVKECNQETVTMLIKGPNLENLVSSLVEEIDFSVFDDPQLELRNQIIQKLQNGKYEIKEWNVQVTWTQNEDGSIEIEKTKEYLDALYGGLVSLGETATQTIEEAAFDEKTE